VLSNVPLGDGVAGGGRRNNYHQQGN